MGRQGVVILWLLFLPLIFHHPTVAFVGDSVTLGAYDPGGGYVAYVERELDIYAVRFVEYHLGDAIADWPAVEAIKPDIVVIELGAHSVATTIDGHTVIGCDHLPAHDIAVFRLRYGALLDRAQDTAPSVIVLNVPWLGWDDEWSARAGQYNEAIEQVAGERGAQVVDVFGPLRECGATCLGVDGVHPNALGHKLIGELVSGKLEVER